MYADDLMLMSPSVTVLQKLFEIVEEDLTALEMTINPSKSACIRFGPRYEACVQISPLTTEVKFRGRKVSSTLV